MSKAAKILNEVGETVLETDILETIFPSDVTIQHPAHLMTRIKRQLGEQASRDFENLVCYGKIPEEKGILLQFFEGRTDLVSRSCKALLEKNNGDQLPETDQ